MGGFAVARSPQKHYFISCGAKLQVFCDVLRYSISMTFFISPLAFPTKGVGPSTRKRGHALVGGPTSSAFRRDPETQRVATEGDGSGRVETSSDGSGRVGSTQIALESTLGKTDSDDTPDSDGKPQSGQGSSISEARPTSYPVSGMTYETLSEGVAELHPSKPRTRLALSWPQHRSAPASRRHRS